MTVTQLTFNTLAFANRLKSAGLDPIIAEAQAELLKEVTDNNFVTKQDLHEAKRDLETKEASCWQELACSQHCSQYFTRINGFISI